MRIREYFYGNHKTNLYPHSIEIGLNEVKIFKIGAPQLPDSLLPMGMKAEDNYTKIFQISPCKNTIFIYLILEKIIKHIGWWMNICLASALVNHLLSVSHADDEGDEGDRTNLLETNIAGYLNV